MANSSRRVESPVAGYNFFDVKAFYEDGRDDMFLDRVYAHSPEAAIAEVMRHRADDLPADRLGLLAEEVRP